MTSKVKTAWISTVDRSDARYAINVLMFFAIVYTVYFAKSLLVPVFVAGFVALFCSPLVKGLQLVKVPKPIGSVLVIGALLTLVTYVINLLVEPASRWLQTVPYILHRLKSEVNGVAEPLAAIRGGATAETDSASGAMGGAVDASVDSLIALLAETTVIFAIQLGAIVVITYFFLSFGEDLVRNTVSFQKTMSKKKTIVSVFSAIQNDVSRYVLVISLINILLGICTAAVLYALGVRDALLWGALATMLNFAPYIGPMLLTVILTGVGYIEFYNIQEALIVPGAFLILNFLECQFITPTCLGQRFNVNPLFVVLWMFFWGWLWGAVGMLLAIPLLMCCRILAAQLNLLGGWERVLKSRNSARSL
ncbi:AI-2E family transporter [Gilvimarinus sp. SDUM040013]|uniref:AI-2E family transporter n=1 Tax=Gilvimarinus gilvus TaxID=3058038 RepID=A0ABU4RVB6_9GAMM|nr:AI-2E family transporter [Gilvimarinus sp. SDUM040013]MDO3388514.1 AI-2E family transporter [Gilvimarinus sp. SDUM040013]MDX6848614.1 AI-2E family transporter [Gilvimarinus sp. SDUM040013]